MSCSRATRRGLTAVLLVAALTGASTAGAASPEDRAAARRHSSQAEKLKKRGQLAEACQELEQVERLDPKLPTLIELAECTEQLGKLVEAQAWWALARDRAKRDEKPQSKAKAEARLVATQKRVARLTLQLAANAPAGVQVLSDDAVLDATSLGSAQPMNPGEHVIVVKAAGHDDAKYSVKLADGDNQTLAIAAGPATAARAPSAPAPAAPVVPAAPPAPTVVAAPTNVMPTAPQDAPPATGWWSEQRTAGVIFGSAGVVALGAGSALCIGAKGDVSDRRLTGGAISLAAGGVLFLSGVVLLVSAPSTEAAQRARLSVTPTLHLARDATVLGAAGAF
jgi:hypothetical protein